MRLAHAAALVAFLGGPLVHAEENPHLARARAELNELRYDKARDALGDALKWGKSLPAETAEIYRLTGEVSAALGEAKKAEEAFTRLLAIDPSVRLSSGVSPKISGPFNAALKASQARDPIKVHYESRTGDAPTITLVVDSDPLNMVKGARAMIEGGPSGPDSAEARGKGRIDLNLPPTGKVTVILAAIDEHGNRLTELGREDPIVIEAGPTEGPTAGPEVDTGGATSKPFYARWYLWGGLAVGFAAAGTYFGISMQSDVDKANDLSAQTRMPGGEFSVDYVVAKEYADRAERKALIANINFGAAAACAIVGGVFLYLDLKAKPAEEERTAVAPLPLRDGAGLVVSGRF